MASQSANFIAPPVALRVDQEGIEWDSSSLGTGPRGGTVNDPRQHRLMAIASKLRDSATLARPVNFPLTGLHEQIRHSQ